MGPPREYRSLDGGTDKQRQRSATPAGRPSSEGQGADPNSMFMNGRYTKPSLRTRIAVMPT